MMVAFDTQPASVTRTHLEDLVMRRSILALLALALVAGCASQSSTPGGPQRVSISVTDKGFQPPVVIVKAG